MKITHLETFHFVAHDGRTTDRWVIRHLSAVILPKTGMEMAVVELLGGWLRYADAVSASWETGIGEDAVLGPCWAKIGDGLRGLLNGDLGRMDGGTLDRVLCRSLKKEGFDPETL